MQDDSRQDRTDGERPRAFALLDAGNDAATRLEGVEALGNPSSSMTGSERRIADRLLRVVLTDENATVRAEAIDALYFHGDRYIDELVARVADAVRRRDGDDDPQSVFLRWLTSGHAAYRMAGATGVGAAGSADSPDATRRLREAFDDGDARVRARAVRSYAALGGEEVAPIRPLLRTPNRLVRRAAVDALVSIGTGDATDLLATAAADGGDRLRKTVVDRLADLDSPASATVLLDAMRDPSLAVRRTAASSLARLLAAGDAVRGRDVRERLASDSPFGSDDADHARLFYDVTAGSASTRITTAAERHAMWLCGELAVSEAGSPDDAQRWLLDALAHEDAYVADIAAAYLPRLDGSGLEQALRALAADGGTDPDARARARSAIRRIKAQTAADAADRSLDYIYVRRPADYTEKRSQ